jgi:hypothetical protein
MYCNAPHLSLRFGFMRDQAFTGHRVLAIRELMAVAITVRSGRSKRVV